jgi:type I restriction enzyme S subunit
MNVLLSIKPEFAEKILSGGKRYEFRKTVFSDPEDVDTIFLYASSPVQRIVGAFTIDEVISDSPASLWRKYGHDSGISDRSRFMNYFEGAEEGYAIGVDHVHEFEHPINPAQRIDDFSPPVSFYYLQEDSDLNMTPQLPDPMIRGESPDLLQFSSD